MEVHVPMEKLISLIDKQYKKAFKIMFRLGQHACPPMLPMMCVTKPAAPFVTFP